MNPLIIGSAGLGALLALLVTSKGNSDGENLPEIRGGGSDRDHPREQNLGGGQHRRERGLEDEELGRKRRRRASDYRNRQSHSGAEKRRSAELTPETEEAENALSQPDDESRSNDAGDNGDHQSSEGE